MAKKKSAEKAARDNCLILVADDLGVDKGNVYPRNDLYGHSGEGVIPGPTARIDGPAAEWILFCNACLNPVCVPTRPAALTGRYGFRTAS